MLAGQHLFGVSLLQLAPSDEAAQNVFAQSVVPSPTTPAFAGIGHEVVVSTIVAPRPGEAVGKDAARQIFAKGLADIGLGRVVVAPPAISLLPADRSITPELIAGCANPTGATARFVL